MSDNNADIKQKKNRVTGVVLIVMIALVIGVLGYTILGEDPPIAGGMPGGTAAGGSASGGSMPGGVVPGAAAEGDTVYTVLAERVTVDELKDYIKVNGDVISENSVDIYPDAAGKLTKLDISLGSYVRKGQVIAEVDPSLPGQVYVASPVRSTITGTVTDLPYKVGATIASTSVPVATVGNLADLLLLSYIPEKNMAEIAVGQKAEIQFEPYKGEIFTGTVSEISPVLDRESRTLEIRISLDVSDSRIKSGMFGSVRLFTETKTGVLTVSGDSVTDSAKGTFVYVINSENKVEQRFVEEGLTVDGVTEIVSGLEEGELIVSRGQSMLQNGSSVKVAE